MPLDGTYQAQTSTHPSQPQAGLPSGCSCWAKPCHHLSSLTAPHPARPLHLLLLKPYAKRRKPFKERPFCRQSLSRALHPPGQWLRCCPVKPTPAAQDSSKALTPSQGDAGLLSHLPEIQVETGYLLRHHQNLKAVSRLHSPHNWKGELGEGLVAKKTF